MKSSVLTKEEYVVSKTLLKNFVSSQKVMSVYGEENVKKIHNWLDEKIFPNEESFVFYKRKHICHYGEYSNSPNEGNNYGVA
jgi:hypothetical protein